MNSKTQLGRLEHNVGVMWRIMVGTGQQVEGSISELAALKEQVGWLDQEGCVMVGGGAACTAGVAGQGAGAIGGEEHTRAGGRSSANSRGRRAGCGREDGST